MTPIIDLRLSGPTELEWAATCNDLQPFVWPKCKRLVVVSPHPDDETFGAAGLIGEAISSGLAVLIISVTDGEAASDSPDLADIRTTELANAVKCLDPSRSIRTVRLAFADSRLSQSLDALTREIGRRIRPDDLVVCPLPDDGHPDHWATSMAATDAAAAVGARVRWFPIWAWHCHEPTESSLAQGQRLSLSEVSLYRKRRAAACYVSQIDGDSPVVPTPMLARLLRPFEVFVRPS